MPRDIQFNVAKVKADRELQDLARDFDAAAIPWAQLSSYGVLNRIMPRRQHKPTSGKILAYAKLQVSAFREHLGISVCVFKIGVTCNPVCRYLDYLSRNYDAMWIIHESNSVPETHMLEAALISVYHTSPGCRNAPDSGGEGALNKASARGPYFTYVTGGRADKNKRLG